MTLRAYVEAWTRHDIEGVLATLTGDCVVVESYGPVYRGHERVRAWMRAWFAAGGSVDAWEITSETETETAAGDGPDGARVQVAEWVFTCTWQGASHTFDGATIARLDAAGERIARLREYATTAPLYDWTGTWRN